MAIVDELREHLRAVAAGAPTPPSVNGVFDLTVARRHFIDAIERSEAQFPPLRSLLKITITISYPSSCAV